MSDTIVITRLSCADFVLTWTDGDGDPIDLTGYEVVIAEASSAALKAAAVRIDDAAAGVCTIIIDPSIAQGLYLGRSNWFRAAIRAGGGCLLTTPAIWIDTL